MDYRNRYRRGGIVGLQEGGSWWNRLKGYMGNELARSAASSTPEAMEKRARDNALYGLGGVPSPEEMEYLSGPRERRGYTGPKSQEGQRAAMLAEEADAPDNRMQLMRMLQDGRLTEDQYQAGMDNLMFGGAGRPRPKDPLDEPASTPAATADAEEAATTQAIAAAEAAAPRKASGRFLSEAEQRAAGTYMPGVSDLERRWSDVGLSPGDVPFVNDAIIEDALAQRNMTGRYGMPDPLAGLMMSPKAPGSRQDILGDVRRRELLEDDAFFDAGLDPLAGLMMSPEAPRSRQDILSNVGRDDIRADATQADQATQREASEAQQQQQADRARMPQPEEPYPVGHPDYLPRSPYGRLHPEYEYDSTLFDPDSWQNLLGRIEDPMADFDLDLGTGGAGAINPATGRRRTRDPMADFDLSLGTGGGGGRDLDLYSSPESVLRERYGTGSDMPAELRDYIQQNVDSYPSELTNLLFEDQDPTSVREQDMPRPEAPYPFGHPDYEPDLYDTPATLGSDRLKTLDELTPGEMETYHSITQSNLPDAIKYQMYEELLSRGLEDEGVFDPFSPTLDSLPDLAPYEIPGDTGGLGLTREEALKMFGEETLFQPNESRENIRKRWDSEFDPVEHERLRELGYGRDLRDMLPTRDSVPGRRFSHGGVIPGYGVGGFLKNALTMGAGAINPALGAGVGGIMGLLGKGSKKKGFMKGMLGGLLTGLGTSKLREGALSGWRGAKGAADKLSGFDKAKTLLGGIASGLGGKEGGLQKAIEAYRDPKVLSMALPMYAQLSSPDGGTDTSPGAMIAQQTPVMGASANPANWQDGRFVDPGQQKVADIMRSAMGGVIPGYQYGGMYGEEGDEFDEPAYRPRPRRRRIAPREVRRPTRRQVEEEEEARLRENVEPTIPATIAAMPPTPAPRPEAPVEAPPENVEPVAPPTIARPPERVEGLPTPPPVVPTRPVAPPPPPPVAPPRQAPPGSGGDEIGDGPDLARQMAMVEQQTPLTSGAGGMGGEFEGDEYGDEYTPTKAVYSGGPTQTIVELDDQADEYEARTQPIMDQVRDVVPNTAAFMPEPGEEGEGGGEGNLFLDSDPGDYGTPVGRTAETTYDMNPYGELPQEVIDGTRELTQTEINERANRLETETRDQIQQPDPLLQDPVGADPTHGLDDGGERPGDLGFVDQTALSPAEDPTRQFVENQFTGPAGHGRYMGHGYNQRTAPVASTVPAKTGPPAGSVADHQDYVAGYHPETSRGTGEAAANTIGLNPMKPQDQSALSQQQQDFISQFGKAEGGQIQDAPEQIRGLVKAALMGTLPDSSIDVTQLMAEVDMTYPGLIEAIANEIRAERQMAGDGPPIVSEGYIPPFDDGMPESTGRVDDRAAVVSPMSDNAVAAGLERSLAEGGKVPISAVVAPEEYILDKQDTAASVQDLKAAVDHVAEASPRVSGPPMWDATRRRLDMEQGINA